MLDAFGALDATVQEVSPDLPETHVLRHRLLSDEGYDLLAPYRAWKEKEL